MQSGNRKKAEPMKVQFDIMDITNQFLYHLSSITNNVRIIHHEIDNSTEETYLPLQTENLPIMVMDDRQEMSINEQRKIAINWVINQAFENIVSGIFISLKKGCKYLSLYALSQDKETQRTKEEYEKEFEKIEKEIEQHSFYTFINRIEEMSKKKIPYTEEIASFIKFRNCLVHGNGKVRLKDLDQFNQLRIKWIEKKSIVEINGKAADISSQMRKNETIIQKIQHFDNHMELSYSLGDDISIDINEFNGIAYTGVIFAKGLTDIMPRPKLA